MPTDAFEAMAKSILAGNSCLKRDLPVTLAQLHHLLPILPGSESAAQVRLQPKGQPALPTAGAMRPAADLVAAAAGHMPALQAQVPSTTHPWQNFIEAGNTTVYPCKDMQCTHTLSKSLSWLVARRNEINNQLHFAKILLALTSCSTYCDWVMIS